MDTAPASEGLTGDLATSAACNAFAVTTAPRKSPATPRTGSGSLSKNHYSNRVVGRGSMPQARQTGDGHYLGQLLRTALPLALGDLAALILSFAICFVIGLRWHSGSNQFIVTVRWFVPSLIGLLAINSVLGLYPAVRMGLVEEIRRLCMSLSTLLLVNIGGLRFSTDTWSNRLLFSLVAIGLSAFLMPLFRSRLRRWLAKTNWWGFPTLVCGNDAAVLSVYQWLQDNRRLGLRPVAVITDAEGLSLQDDTAEIVATWQQTRAIAEKRRAYWAVMVEPADSEVEAAALVDQHLGIIPHVCVVSELTGMPDHWNRHQMDEGLEGLMVERHLMLPVPILVKRGMDLGIAVIAGTLLAPLFLALAIIVKLTSRGPVFYGHERVGKGNTRFRAWKFRTMIDNAENLIEEYLLQHPQDRHEWERDHKLKHDPRVTAVGRFMRKWSIDELPQLWNVFQGEMSAVGPRPIVPNEIEKYDEHFDIFCSVLPGMTGLWQVCGRNDTSFEERIRLGIYYIHHWSPWLDLYLLASTVKTVLFTKGAY